MRKLGVAVAMAALLLIGGSVAWKAEATSAVTSETLPALVKKFSLVEKAACSGWGRHCPPGYTWVCRPVRCWCRPC